MTFLIIMAISLGVFFSFILLIILIKSIQFKKGKKRIHKKYKNRYSEKIKNMGEVNSLKVTPVVDFYAIDDAFKTEAGVSYLIEADGFTILMDVGFNKNKEHPSPFLHNLNKMGKSIEDIDMIFFSHLHLDHVGGMKEQKKKEFSFSAGESVMPEIPVYSPEPIHPSSNNPYPKEANFYQNHILKEPTKIKPGIASTGVVARYFFLGETFEHSLAINVAGKGLVIIVGCGHQTIEKILEMAKENFNEPVYGVIGGLHYPVKNGRIMAGPLNLQGIMATEVKPLMGITEDQMESAISIIQKSDLKLLALSPHDSSDFALSRFQEVMGSSYQTLKVGETVEINS